MRVADHGCLPCRVLSNPETACDLSEIRGEHATKSAEIELRYALVPSSRAFVASARFVLVLPHSVVS